MTLYDYPALEKIERILVVRMRHLGDVLLTTPLFSNLKRVLPNAQIDAFINKESFEILEGHPGISQFFLYDRRLKQESKIRRLLQEVRLLNQVREKKYDLILNLTEGDRGALIALISGAPYRVGFDPGKSGFLGKRRIYTHLVKICPNSRHTVERQLDVLRRIGIFPSPLERDLLFVIPESARVSLREKLKAFEIREGNYLVVHPVSRWLFKSPSPVFFANLIEKLTALGFQILLTGGEEKESKEHIAAILRLVPPEFSPLDFSGKTVLKELGALLSLARALITVDSLPLHLASSLKTPVVALFGPSSEVNWGPWQHPTARVITSKVSCRPCYMDGCGGSKRSDCLEQLDPETVIRALYEVIKRSETDLPDIVDSDVSSPLAQY